MWAFSRACSSGRTLQPSPSSTEHQQRLRDKSIKHPPPGKQAKGSSSNQVLENSRCSDRNTEAVDEDSNTRVLHRPAASQCPPQPPAGEAQRPRRGQAHPSARTQPLTTPPGGDQRGLWLHSTLGARGPSPLGARHSWELSAGPERRTRSSKASPGEARCPLMSMNHRHTLKIPVNEMSNTHHPKPRPPGPAEESAHLPAEPSPLSPNSTIHIYGKGGERKEYIFRGLYNSSFAHQSLSFPSPASLRDSSLLSSPPHQHFQQKRRVRRRCTPRQGQEKTPPPHNTPQVLISCH